MAASDITVFVPTHNRSTLVFCLASLVAQTAKFAEKTVVHNLSMCDALTVVMRQCKTKYVLKCDDDFMLHPSALAWMLSDVAAVGWKTKDAMHWWHLWDIRERRKIQSIKIYSLSAMKTIGFRCDHFGRVDPLFLRNAKRRGFAIVGHPRVVALHGSGSRNEQIECRLRWRQNASAKTDARWNPSNIKASTLSPAEQFAQITTLIDAANRKQ